MTMEKLNYVLSRLTEKQRESAKVVPLRNPNHKVYNNRLELIPPYMEYDVYFNQNGMPLTVTIDSEGAMQARVTDMDDPNIVMN